MGAFKLKVSFNPYTPRVMRQGIYFFHLTAVSCASQVFLSSLQHDHTIRTLPDLDGCVNIDPNGRLEIIPCAPYGKELITDTMKFVYSKVFNSFQTPDGVSCWTVTPKNTLNIRDCKIRRGTESKQSFTFLMDTVKRHQIVAPGGKYAGMCVGYEIDEEKVRFRNSAHSVKVFNCDTSAFSVIY